MIDFLAEEKECSNLLKKFEEDLKNLRTGRASVSFLDNVTVNIYGNIMKIEHIASLHVQDAKTIMIEPWDKSNMPAIEDAIQKSNLGVAPISESGRIRISLPILTEERRKELVKILKKKAEDLRILIRHRRDDIWKTIQDEEKAKNISETQKFLEKEKMEKMIENQNKKVEEIVEKKEKEIMEI